MSYLAEMERLFYASPTLDGSRRVLAARQKEAVFPIVFWTVVAGILTYLVVRYMWPQGEHAGVAAVFALALSSSLQVFIHGLSGAFIYDSHCRVLRDADVKNKSASAYLSTPPPIPAREDVDAMRVGSCVLITTLVCGFLYLIVYLH